MKPGVLLLRSSCFLWLMLLLSPSLLASSFLLGTPSPTRSSTITFTRLLSSSSDDETTTTGLSRRQLGEVAFAATGLGLTAAGTRESTPQDYGLWGLLPVGTYKRKPTIRETVVDGQIWTFDQKFGILNVQVPLRMTVLKIPQGLLVYNPIAATRECLQLVQELVQEHGPIRHILLGSVALEHKVYASVFAQKFPTAQVWLTPGQYAVPVNLPTTYLGFPAGRTHTMPSCIEQAPAEWREAGLNVAVLGPIISRDGAFCETVLLHQPTKTLCVTDTTVVVQDQPPAIYETDPAPLLYHARDSITDIVADTPAVRRKGWKRIVLFGLYFQPAAIRIKTVQEALAERRPDINPDFAGIYPWDWVLAEEETSWKALTANNSGKPLVAPILQTLLLNRSPVEVLDFADTVASWDIQRIIPAHLQNDLPLTGKDYRAAFGFLEERGVPNNFPKPLEADLQTLRDAEASLLESGAIAPAPPLVGGKATRQEIIDQTTYKCRAGVCAPRAEA